MEQAMAGKSEAAGLMKYIQFCRFLQSLLYNSKWNYLYNICLSLFITCIGDLRAGGYSCLTCSLKIILELK